MEYLSSRDAAILDINSAYFGIHRSELMKAAGRGVYEAIAAKKPIAGKKISVFCGSGNNGGDGFVCAKHLHENGAEVIVCMVGEGPKTKEAKQAFEQIKGKIPISGSENAVYDVDIIVDAILGTGMTGKLRDPIKTVVRQINASRAFKVSVDVPSGLTEEGKGYCVRPDLVVTFHKPKKGMERFRTVVKDIGIPKEAESQVGPGDLIVNLFRKPGSHKGENGRVLIIGGSSLYYGAPILSAHGALNSGADLVYLAVPECNYEVTRCHSPDFIVRKYPGDHLAEDSLDQVLEGKYDSILIGPGLGPRIETMNAVRKLMNRLKGTKVVLDADAIKAVRGMKFKEEAVLTPHAGEFEILTGKRLPKEIEGRRKLVLREVRKLGSVILLKAPVDIIASPRGKAKYNPTGNAGMTVGGTGDILAGVVAGFLAQGMEPFQAAGCGAFINGVAGDELYKRKGCGFTASDLAWEIPYTIKRTMDFEATGSVHSK